VLQKDPVDALAQQAARFGIADPGGDHQHAAVIAELPRRRQELRGALRSQIVIEQHEIEVLLRQQRQRLANAGAMRDREVGLRGQGPGQAFTEQRVIVDQQGVDRLLWCHDWLIHPSNAFSTGQSSTVKQLPGPRSAS
jgi:hypothetical protein